MNHLSEFLNKSNVLLLLIILGFSGCKSAEDATPAGELSATASATSISKGGTVTFADNSTEVKSRTWTFTGGNPATSVEAEQVVTYATAGTFSANLAITFKDGKTATQDFSIDVSDVAGTLTATANKTVTTTGGTVTYSDASTEVKSRTWTFPGGNPANSTNADVAVSYADAGSYTATLQVSYNNNTTESKTFDVKVVAPYVIFSEGEANPQMVTYTWTASGRGVTQVVDTVAYEGQKSMRFTLNETISQAYGMTETNGLTVKDITEFKNGYLKIAMKSTSPDDIRIRIQSAGQQAYVLSKKDGTNAFDFPRDGKWHLLSIHLSEFFTAGNGGSPLTADQITTLLTGFNSFRLRTWDIGTNVANPVGYEFYADQISFTVE